VWHNPRINYVDTESRVAVAHGNRVNYVDTESRVAVHPGGTRVNVD
jgi:hypothetical protein